MKRFLPFVILALMLTGCSLLPTAVPTASDADLATKVAQILTSQPTATSQVIVQSPTAGLPTVRPTDVLAPVATATEVLAPTETPTPTSTPSPSSTPTLSLSDPAARLGAATWSDNMDSNDNWPVGLDKFTSIEFADGRMRLTGLSTTDGWRLTWPDLTNFYLEMTIQTGTCTGIDRYGMIVRVPDGLNPDRGYLFGFTCDGQYSLRRWNAKIGAKGEMINLINWTASPLIKEGSNQTNKMGLMAVNDRLILYANGQMLNEVNDNVFLKGFFGVFIGARETADFTVRVDQVRYWENPTP